MQTSITKSNSARAHTRAHAHTRARAHADLELITQHAYCTPVRGGCASAKTNCLDEDEKNFSMSQCIITIRPYVPPADRLLSLDSAAASPSSRSRFRLLPASSSSTTTVYEGEGWEGECKLQLLRSARDCLAMYTIRLCREKQIIRGDTRSSASLSLSLAVKICTPARQQKREPGSSTLSAVMFLDTLEGRRRRETRAHLELRPVAHRYQ